MRILVTDGMDKGAIARLRELGHEVVEQFYEPDELGAALKEFDVVVVRSKTKVRKEHIDAAKAVDNENSRFITGVGKVEEERLIILLNLEAIIGLQDEIK